MDAADLRIFETVARAGAMSRAAVELNTVQSNVTARVRSLEGELGTPLFTRSRRGVALTDAGRRLLPYAERLRTMLVDARRAVRDDGAPTGPLTLGTLETTAALRLARPLARFTARWPEVDLALRTGTTAELVGSTLRRDVEGAFVCGPVDHPDLVERVVFRETLAVVGGPALRSIEALRAGRETRIVVLRAGCSYRQRLEDVLARRGVVATRTLE
ncbi:MAG: LysR family transcriptional regulator, partial [Rhodospirillales bacterium]|nr:LysR family transcriptional regulator [Rhodospirillales bacterium]